MPFDWSALKDDLNEESEDLAKEAELIKPKKNKNRKASVPKTKPSEPESLAFHDGQLNDLMDALHTHLMAYKNKWQASPKVARQLERMRALVALIENYEKKQSAEKNGDPILDDAVSASSGHSPP